jgi:anti-anti-sigma regulatory factor
MEGFTQQRGVTVAEVSQFYDFDDTGSADAFGDALLEHARTIDPPLLVVDLSQTVGINSLVVGKLLSAKKTLDARHGALAISGANDYCRAIFRVMNLEKLLEFFPSSDEAVAALLQRAAG